MDKEDVGMPEDIAEAKEYTFKLTLTNQEYDQLQEMAMITMKNYPRKELVSDQMAMEGAIAWIIESWFAPDGPYQDFLNDYGEENG